MASSAMGTGLTRPASIETGASWAIALTALAVYTVSFGAPVITVVALKPIAAELGDARSVPGLAFSLAWFGAAVGGIPMGWMAERFGIRRVVMFGALMIAAGLAISTSGGAAALYIGHGVFIGLLGNACINAPLYVYVARWFDRRRGSAVALISSGQYLAGTVWPVFFASGIEAFGWRGMMLFYAVIAVVTIVPASLVAFRPPPDGAGHAGPAAGGVRGDAVLGLRPNAVMGLLCFAGLMCCVPMAMPQGHLVAFCTDIGIAPTHGAAMLSVLLGCAFVSRQFWGWVTDRIGGLRTVLAGSVCQITAMTGFLLTQNEAGLFAVAAIFGLGFSGIIPAYVVAIRELFPAAEASWRVPTVLLFTGSGMALGGWLAGIIYDWAGFYAIAFATGIVFNAAHIIVIGSLVLRQSRVRLRAVPAPTATAG
ncbi:MAG TPA: MFS transporter [Stellaceae bacterium]|nr:MFS transporter [Stellaceae bacterium]